MTALLPAQPLDVRKIRRTAIPIGPWTREQVATLAVIDLIALIGIEIGAWNAHSQKTTSAALGWLIVALLAVGFSGLMHAMFLLRCRRGIGLAIRFIVDPRRLPSSGERAGHVESAGRLVAWIGSARYHREDCVFVAGREVDDVVIGVGDALWRVPCEVCNP